MYTEGKHLLYFLYLVSQRLPWSSRSETVHNNNYVEVVVRLLFAIFWKYTILANCTFSLSVGPFLFTVAVGYRFRERELVFPMFLGFFKVFGLRTHEYYCFFNKLRFLQNLNNFDTGTAGCTLCCSSVPEVTTPNIFSLEHSGESVLWTAHIFTKVVVATVWRSSSVGRQETVISSERSSKKELRCG